MTPAESLALAVAAARAGGEVLRSARADLEIGFKAGRADLVTSADRSSQEAIFAVLSSAAPDHALLGEEGVAGADDAEHVWIVDPLDGTTNYAHDIPPYAISIALSTRGRTVCGVVYDPCGDHLYAATAGAGATCDGAPLRVSDTASLDRAMLITQVQSSDAGVISEFCERTRRLLMVAGAVRNFGCPALVLCHVASGRAEGFCERWLKAWDLAAGALIVEEAGGRVTDFQGEQIGPLEPTDLVATNGRLHDRLIAALEAGQSELEGTRA